MQTALAQMVALTCHGNALLRGIPAPAFFPGNSTCLFCESVTFLVTGQPAGGDPQTAVFADSPDAWLGLLPSRGTLQLRLRQRAQNLPGISDRNASAFVGGGKVWALEVVRKGSISEFWREKWEIGDRQAPDRKIWRASYWLAASELTGDSPLRPLDEVAAALRATLLDIRAFADANQCGNFVKCFSDALRAFDQPEADIGYHRDLAPPGFLPPTAQAILKAAQAAWVFGGMGSWNDMGFSGETQKEYDRVSDQLFNQLNDAIEAAAGSSAPASV